MAEEYQNSAVKVTSRSKTDRVVDLYLLKGDRKPAFSVCFYIKPKQKCSTKLLKNGFLTFAWLLFSNKEHVRLTLTPVGLVFSCAVDLLVLFNGVLCNVRVWSIIVIDFPQLGLLFLIIVKYLNLRQSFLMFRLAVLPLSFC